MSIGIPSAIPSPVADGVYPYQIPSPVAIPQGPQTNLIGQVGTGNWGPIGIPMFYNTLAQAISIWGNEAQYPASTSYPLSLVGATQSATPEGVAFVDVRVADGTQAAASLQVLDVSGGVVGTWPAVYTGTDGNTIQVSINLTSGSYTASPYVQAVVSIANRPTWTSGSFAAGNATGYVQATFIANFNLQLAGNAFVAVCPYLKATGTAGGSANHPAVGPFTASGGLSGSGSVTTAILLGTNVIGAPTGMYALAGTGCNVFHLAGCTDIATAASTMAAFGQANSCVGIITMPQGTSTSAAIALKNSSNASSPWLVVCKDFLLQNDVVDQAGALYYAPDAKVCAGIASLQPWQYPSNKPYNGFSNLIGTERSAQPYSNAELGQLQQAGILIITNPIPRGSIFGFPHGMTSNATTPISDTRMLIEIGVTTTEILGNFVGEPQTPPPAVGVNDTDRTRTAARNALNAYLAGLANPVNPQIAAYSVVMNSTNNTVTSVQQGYLYDYIQVETLAGIKFILSGLQIGETVQVQQA